MKNLCNTLIRSLLAIMVLLSSTIVADAQSIRRISKTTKEQRDNSSAKTNSQQGKRPLPKKEKSEKQDTVYCFQTKKQHGWFAPVGILTKEEASHQNISYRFTNRNAQGNWCKMELIDGYGNYTTGGMSPYILKIGSADTDSLANKDWIEKIKTECIYEFIPDPTGKEVIQERAYDKDMNLVYTYSRTPVGADSSGHKRFVGSYRDSYGLPAEMRRDTTNTYTYGTLVMLTEDRWGNDSIVEYMDAKGLKKPNSDGVAMEVYVRDKDGQTLKQQSRDANGELIIDNWGNCGVEYVWNANHTIASATYMDDNWRPMKMPSLREVDGKGVIKTFYKYDKYGRQTEMSYYTEKDIPDKNAYGVHKERMKYDEKGNMVERRCFDLEGNLVDGAYGWAVFKANYNNEGKPVDFVWLDKDLKPCSKEYYLSRIHYGYDEKGNEVLVEKFYVANGKETSFSKERSTPELKYWSWDDGSYRIDSLDVHGRTTSISFYDAKGNLERVEDWAKQKTSYVDMEGCTLSEETHMDEYGKIIEIEGVARRVTRLDSVSCILYVVGYSAKGEIVNSYYQAWNKDFTKLLAEFDMNAFGVVCRAGGTATVRHYKADVLYNQEGNRIASLIGRDEYNEPDYIVSPSAIYYYQKMSAKWANVFYDENGKTIDDSETLKDTLPKVMSIEVTDSSAYELGFRDNDVILIYGDYSVDLDTVTSYFDFRKQWALRSVLDAKKNKRMVVFRIEDAKNNKYGLVEIKDLIGTPSELGFLAHIRYLTQKQLSRIHDAIKKNIASATPLITKGDLKKKADGGDYYIPVTITDMYRSARNKPYAKQVMDPAVLLGACIKDRNLYWDMRKGKDTEAFEQMLNSKKKKAVIYPDMHFFLTKDMKEVIDLTLDEQFAGTDVLFNTRIGSEDYANLLELNKNVIEELEAIKKEPSPITTKQLLYHWQIIKKEDEPYAPEGYIYLDKDGTCKGNVSEYGKISIDRVTAVYRINRNYDGTWHHGGTLLTFNPSLEDNTTLQCVDLLGVDGEQKAKMITYLNSVCEENKMLLLNRMSFEHPQWCNELFIRAVTKDTLIIEDGSVFGLKCIKIKGKSRSTKEKTEAKSKRDKKMRQKIKHVDSFIVGQWETEVSEMPGAKAAMSFGANRQMEMTISASYQMADTVKILFDIRLGGEWVMKDDSLTIKNDPSLIRINVDLETNGMDDVAARELKSAFLKYLEPQKEAIVMQFLKGNFFEGTIAIGKLTEEELVTNGITWKKAVPKHIITPKGKENSDE